MDENLKSDGAGEVELKLSLFTSEEANMIVRTLQMQRDLALKLTALHPHDIIVICSFLMAQLSAQLPITNSAYIDCFKFWKEVYEAMVKDHSELQGQEDEIIFILPDDKSAPGDPLEVLQVIERNEPEVLN